MWSAGTDVTLVENITDINDKIYLAAPGDSARLAADASDWYVEDTDLLGLGRPDHEPKASETVPEIIELIGELVDRGLAYPAGVTSTSASPNSRTTASLGSCRPGGDG